MKKAKPTLVLSTPQPLEETPFYLRKAGKPIGGQNAYLCTTSNGHYQAVVFASNRDIAKTKVWVTFGDKAKFWR